MAEGRASGFLGGSVWSVLVRLLFLSLLVGAAMAFLGVTPMGLYDGVASFFRRLIAGGFAIVGDVGMWIVYGAMVVVPLWLILRLLDMRRR